MGRTLECRCVLKCATERQLACGRRRLLNGASALGGFSFLAYGARVEVGRAPRQLARVYADIGEAEWSRDREWRGRDVRYRLNDARSGRRRKRRRHHLVHSVKARRRGHGGRRRRRRGSEGGARTTRSDSRRIEARCAVADDNGRTVRSLDRSPTDARMTLKSSGWKHKDTSYSLRSSGCVYPGTIGMRLAL